MDKILGFNDFYLVFNVPFKVDGILFVNGIPVRTFVTGWLGLIMCSNMVK